MLRPYIGWQYKRSHGTWTNLGFPLETPHPSLLCVLRCFRSLLLFHFFNFLNVVHSSFGFLFSHYISKMSLSQTTVVSTLVCYSDSHKPNRLVNSSLDICHISTGKHAFVTFGPSYLILFFMILLFLTSFRTRNTCLFTCSFGLKVIM